jgi:hypothetical protein
MAMMDPNPERIWEWGREFGFTYLPPVTDENG